MITKIKIGSLELTPENGYLVTAVEDLGYKTKYVSSSILYLHGSKLGDAYFQNRTLAFELIVGGDTVSQKVANKNALFNALTISEHNNDLLRVEITINNSYTVYTNAVIKEVLSPQTAGEIFHSVISFVMETESPFFKDVNSYLTTINLTKGGGGAVPMAIPFAMNTGSTGYSQINNGGNVFVFPKFYFYGELTNPVLTNVTTGKSISLAVSLATEANYYVIDTYERTVLDESGVNKRDKMTGDFLTLLTGNNDFQLLTDDASETGYVKIAYENWYIGL